MPSGGIVEGVRTMRRSTRRKPRRATPRAAHTHHAAVRSLHGGARTPERSGHTAENG